MIMELLMQNNFDPGITISTGAVGVIAGFIAKSMFFDGKGKGKNGDSKHVTKDVCKVVHKSVDEALARIEGMLKDVLKRGDD